MTDDVMKLAVRAGADPHFLAFALAEYAKQNALDELALLAALETTPAGLASARLCAMPRSDATGFSADVDRIAGKFGLNRQMLATMVRYGQVVAELRKVKTVTPEEAEAAILAARDRDK